MMVKIIFIFLFILQMQMTYTSRVFLRQNETDSEDSEPQSNETNPETLISSIRNF